MLDLHNLVVAGEDDFMLPHDGAAPDGGDADLLLVPGLAGGVALVDVFRLVAAGLGRRVGDHQGGARGGVHLPAVVALHNLDVVAVPQDGSGLLHQLQQHIDAQRHVGGAEDGHVTGGGPHLGHLLRGVAGGGQHQGDLSGFGKLQQAVQSGGGGEVDHRVGLAGELGGGGVDGKVPVGGAQHIEAGEHLHRRIVGAQGLHHPAHMAVAAGNDYLQHSMLLSMALSLRELSPPRR